VWTPSLHASRLDEPGVRERSIGRRQRGRGGNLVLPEGRSAASLVADALTVGLQNAGFRVVQPGVAGSTAMEAEILKLWTWDRVVGQGGIVSFEFWTQVRVRTLMPPFQDGAIVCGHEVVARGGPSAGVWTRVVVQGLAGLAADLRGRLAGPNALHLCIGP
jgi:hypothetical protein